MRFIDAIMDGLSRILRITGQVVLVFMMASISYDTVMRYAFTAPTVWTTEVNTFLLVYLALVPAASVLRTGSQLHIGYFRLLLGPRVRLVGDVVIALIGAVFCAVLTWRGAIMAWHAFQYDERMSTTLGTPMVFPFSLIPLGFGLLCLQFLLDLVAALRGRARSDEPVTETI